MKILHTSDWHLGQSFFTKSRHKEHQAFLQWLLETVAAQSIDAVIVAGDVFDTGTPPSYARELYNQFVVDLQALHCTLVVLGGNHDAVSTLNESRQILACLNTHVIASTGIELDQQVITLTDKQGDVGAILCAIPFIRPKDVITSRAGETGLDKRQSLGDAIKNHYASLYELACERRAALAKDIPIIATGHLSAMGVSQSDSVRDIYIGTLDGFAADGFPPADYIALGHIHKPQIVAKQEHIRYCGSPIPLSFDELNTDKSVIVVEFKQGQRESITPITVPRFQPMAVIKGDLDEIAKQLQDPEESKEHSEIPTWLCIEVQSQDYLSDLQERVQGLIGEKQVEVLQLKRSRNDKRQFLTEEKQETLAELTPDEVFEKRLNMESFDDDAALAMRKRITNKFKLAVSQAQHRDSEE
jgi:exonuclease SbcD